jgi:hypothetical protein
MISHAIAFRNRAIMSMRVEALASRADLLISYFMLDGTSTMSKHKLSFSGDCKLKLTIIGPLNVITSVVKEISEQAEIPLSDTSFGVHSFTFEYVKSEGVLYNDRVSVS